MKAKWVNAECPSCKKGFIAHSRGKRGFAKYCSKACANQAQRTLEIRDLNCERCDSKFSAIRDHGVWPRYCSRACFCVAAIKIDCLVCGKKFRKRHDGSNCCSKKCRHIATIARRERTCVQCGKPFTDYSAGRGTQCCSTACQYAYFSGRKSKSWKGGAYVEGATNVEFVYVQKCKYKARHRVVVAAILGRTLLTEERIVHIDGNNTNNDPRNLYMYSSNSECARARQSGPHPKQSNIEPLTYLRTID